MKDPKAEGVTESEELGDEHLDTVAGGDEYYDPFL